MSRGYNLRPEIAGAFGIHQINRLDEYVRIRRANHADWCAHIDSLNLPLQVFPEPENRAHAGFGFPMLLRKDSPLSRADLCAKLEAAGIQTRPISGSNCQTARGCAGPDPSGGGITRGRRFGS